MRNVLCHTTPVSRAKGHSAVGGAAYRAGQNLKGRGQGPEGTDKWFRYSPRRDVVREAFIMTPEGAPGYAKAQDREELWNRVEEIETRKNARLGREIELGFAFELSHMEQRALVEEFVKREVVDKGFVADVAIHNYGKLKRPALSGGTETEMADIRAMAAENVPLLERDEAEAFEGDHVRIKRDRQGNVTGYQRYQPHAHVRVTPRIAHGGEWVDDKKASRELNKHEKAMNWRYDWAKLQNEYLERAGSDVRVTCTPEHDGDFSPYRRSDSGQSHQLEAIAERLQEQDEPKTEEAKEARAAQLEAHERAKELLEADREFNRAHNDVLKQAFIEQQGEALGEDGHEARLQRLTQWYRNIGRRLEGLREALPEKAAAWRERLEAVRPRLRSWFGYEVPEGGSAQSGGDGYEPPGQELTEPEQER